MVSGAAPSMTLKAPFPYFGGKARIAADVWARFGAVPNYVEPFAGSLAVLLSRPPFTGSETVNDLDGMIANFWRATRDDPDAVAHHADWPVFENDLHARHAWLVQRKEGLQTALEGDPDYYDAKIAGWWLWGICAWIGSGWCSGDGPWQQVDGHGDGGGLPAWRAVVPFEDEMDVKKAAGFRHTGNTIARHDPPTKFEALHLTMEQCIDRLEAARDRLMAAAFGGADDGRVGTRIERPQ